MNENISIDNLTLLDIQPSQFYVSQEKINRIKTWFDPDELTDFEPLPIKWLNGRIIFTDGHTRAWVAYEAGLTKVPLIWDEDELRWDLYQNCVDECLRRGVRSVADFRGRIMDAEAYKVKWNGWCDRMHEEAEIRKL